MRERKELKPETKDIIRTSLLSAVVATTTTVIFRSGAAEYPSRGKYYIRYLSVVQTGNN